MAQSNVGRQRVVDCWSSNREHAEHYYSITNYVISWSVYIIFNIIFFRPLRKKITRTMLLIINNNYYTYATCVSSVTYAVSNGTHMYLSLWRRNQKRLNVSL